MLAASYLASVKPSSKLGSNSVLVSSNTLTPNRAAHWNSRGPGWLVLSLFFLALHVGLSPSNLRAQDDAKITASTDAENIAAEEIAAEEEALPQDFDGLVKLKTQRIGTYQEAVNGTVRGDAIEALVAVVQVEMALLKMAEDELGQPGIDLANTYRKTVQSDGALLASELYEVGDYERSAKVYRTVLSVARRRSDLTMETLNDLLALTVRATRLTEASDDEIAEYEQAVSDAVEALGLAKAEQFEKAAEMLVKSAEVQRRIGGVTPHLSGEYSRCAAWFKESEKLDLAEQYYRESLAALDQTIGRETIRFTSSLYNLGVLLENQERFAEAEQFLSETRMIENRIGVDLRSQLITLNELAGLYRKMEAPDKFDRIVGAYRFLEARSSLGLETVAPFLPVDAYAAISLSPAALIQAPELDYMPHEVIRSFVNETLGIDPLKIESLVLFLTLPFDENQANWGVLIKTVANQPLNMNLPGVPEKLEESGIEFSRFTSNGRETACFATLREGLFVAGNQTSVKQVLAIAAITGAVTTGAVTNGAAGNGIGKLAARLLGMHGGGDALAAVDLAKLQVMLQAMMEEIPPIPGQFQRIAMLPTRLDSLGATVAFSKPPYFTLKMEPRADITAEAVRDVVNDAMRNGAGILMQQVEQNIQEDSPFASEALQQYLTRMVNTKLGSLLASVEDGKVVIRLDSAFEFQGPVLVALLLPAVQAARAAAQRMEGQNHLKMLGLAFWNYHDTHGHFPTRQLQLQDGGEGLSWRVQILPFLDEIELYEQFHLDEPWNSEHNLKLVQQMPVHFLTPGVELEPGMTNVLTLDGPGTAMTNGIKLKAADVVDGTSNTILIAEANPEQAVVWTSPSDLPFDIESPKTGLGEARESGFNVLLLDGSVQFESADMPASRLKAMATRAGGEVFEM